VSQSRLSVVPVTLKDAQAFVRQHHRHHREPNGSRWCLGVRDATGALRGVAMAGRPVSRALDDGTVCEITRVATDGCPNACSALYGACRRVAQAMGYRRILTYTLVSEPGTSLLATGWSKTAHIKGDTWDRPNRQRQDKHPTQDKIRWEAPMASAVGK
jgi:hypothetical protein